MKKLKRNINISIVFFLLLVITACGNVDTNHDLSGKSFDVAYAPIPFAEEANDPNQYDSLMEVAFNAENELEHITFEGTEGSYEFIGKQLIVTFTNDNEELAITFSNLEESDKDFSLYSAVISDVSSNIMDSNKVEKLSLIRDKIRSNTPVEFIELN